MFTKLWSASHEIWEQSGLTRKVLQTPPSPSGQNVDAQPGQDRKEQRDSHALHKHLPSGDQWNFTFEYKQRVWNGLWNKDRNKVLMLIDSDGYIVVTEVSLLVRKSHSRIWDNKKLFVLYL